MDHAKGARVKAWLSDILQAAPLQFYQGQGDTDINWRLKSTTGMNLPKAGLTVLGRNDGGIFQEGLSEQERPPRLNDLRWAPANDSGGRWDDPEVPLGFRINVLNFQLEKS